MTTSRNALDTIHAKPGYEVIVENFKLRPGNKFTAPSWRYDFSSKNGGNIGETDLLTDLDTMLKNALDFLEELFLLCIRETWDDRYPYKLCRLPEDEIDQKCPIPHFVSMSKSPS